MTGLTGYSTGVFVVIGISMRLCGVTLTNTGHVDAVMSPVVGITAGGEFVVYYLMAINTDYAFGYMNLSVLGH